MKVVGRCCNSGYLNNKVFGSYSRQTLTAPLSSVASYATFKANAPVPVTSDKVIGLHLYGDLRACAEAQLQFTAGDELNSVVSFVRFWISLVGNSTKQTECADSRDRLSADWTIRIVETIGCSAAQSEIFIDNMLLTARLVCPPAVNDPVTYIKKYIRILFWHCSCCRVGCWTPAPRLYTLNGNSLKSVNSHELNVSALMQEAFVCRESTWKIQA